MKSESQAVLGGVLIAFGVLSFIAGVAIGIIGVRGAWDVFCCGLGFLMFFVGLLLATTASKQRKAVPPMPVVVPPPARAPPPRVPFCPKCGSATWWNPVETVWSCTNCGHILPEYVPPPGTL